MHTKEEFFTFSVRFAGNRCRLEEERCPLGQTITAFLNGDHSAYLACAEELERAFHDRDRRRYRELSRQANGLIRAMPLYGILAREKEIDPPPFQSRGEEGFFANRTHYQDLADDLRWLRETVVPYLERREQMPFPQHESWAQVELCYLWEEGELWECMTFGRLRDFLSAELGKTLMYGSCPKKCRNCGQWFFKERGTSFEYCAGPAPGEKGRTCREVGARASFGQKVKDNEVWKLHQRAYKKYYARVLKKTMSREEFQGWTREAEKLRDEALEAYAQAMAAGKPWSAEAYQAALNRL